MKMKLSTSERRSLASVLKYKNESVVDRFRSEHNLGLAESKMIFKDLLYFLWLSEWARLRNIKYKDQNTFIGIRKTLLIVDEMWHTFVLYSQSYKEFCEKYFKSFIHHYPGPSYIEFHRKKLSVPKNTEDVWEIQKSITKQILGNQVYIRWYKKYKKYSPIYIKQIQLKAAIKKENGTLT